jgi:CDGSH-type Zn-finger protein
MRPLSAIVRIALYCYGASNNKPFCDGMHRPIISKTKKTNLKLSIDIDKFEKIGKT